MIARSKNKMRDNSNRGFAQLSTLLLLASSLLILAGCSDGVGTKIAALNETGIQRLVNCYTFYHVKNGYKGPKDEADFKKFIAMPGNEKGFERAGIDTTDIDAMFISSRDEKPFRVKYNVTGSSFGFSAPIIFESEGVDGEIMVGFGGAKTELMSKEEADKLFMQRVKKITSRGDAPEDGVAAEAAE